MNAKIRKWGNSLAMRIPKAYAEEVSLAENSAVQISVVEGKLIVEPAQRQAKTNLRQLLAGVTKQNLHGEIDFGPARGKEAW